MSMPAGSASEVAGTPRQKALSAAFRRQATATATIAADKRQITRRHLR